jgi:hypothetical protein
MSSLLAMTIVAMVAGAAVSGFVASRLRKRRKLQRRVIEQPNSHYTSKLVINRDTLTRWHDIPLDKVHEINRGEVDRLLKKAEALGVDSLRAPERVFLDQIALITGTTDAQAVRAEAPRRAEEDAGRIRYNPNLTLPAE